MFPSEYKTKETLKHVEKHVCLRQTNNIWWLMDYKHTAVHDAIVESKYFNNTEVFKSFAHIIMTYAFFIVNNSIIIPLPSSNLQKRIKGYNQTEEIIKEISNIIKNSDTQHISIETKLLVRKKNTKSQTQLTKVEREKNQLGTFRVTKGFTHLHNKKIVLLDDVCTTGSTLREAKKCLEESGFTDVVCLALAYQASHFNNS